MLLALWDVGISGFEEQMKLAIAKLSLPALDPAKPATIGYERNTREHYTRLREICLSIQFNQSPLFVNDAADMMSSAVRDSPS